MHARDRQDHFFQGSSCFCPLCFALAYEKYGHGYSEKLISLFKFNWEMTSGPYEAALSAFGTPEFQLSQNNTST